MIRANSAIPQTIGIRGFAGLLGGLLITIGAVLVLFVGWHLSWTDVVADADAAEVVTTMEQDLPTPGLTGDLVGSAGARAAEAFRSVNRLRACAVHLSRPGW